VYSAPEEKLVEPAVPRTPRHTCYIRPKFPRSDPPSHREQKRCTSVDQPLFASPKSRPTPHYKRTPPSLTKGTRIIPVKSFDSVDISDNEDERFVSLAPRTLAVRCARERSTVNKRPIQVIHTYTPLTLQKVSCKLNRNAVEVDVLPNPKFTGSIPAPISFLTAKALSSGGSCSPVIQDKFTKPIPLNHCLGTPPRLDKRNCGELTPPPFKLADPLWKLGVARDQLHIRLATSRGDHERVDLTPRPGRERVNGVLMEYEPMVIDSRVRRR
jgi:hypothetical protein